MSTLEKKPNMEIVGIVLLMAAFALGTALYMRFYFKPMLRGEDDNTLDL